MHARTFLLVAALAALPACGMFKVSEDPNVTTLATQATAQVAENNQHTETMATKRSADIAACSAKDTELKQAICMLGLSSIYAIDGGRAGIASQNLALPAYTPPPTPMQQLSGAVRDVTPLIGTAINAAVAIDGTREREATNRHTATVDANRETAIAREIAQAGTLAVRVMGAQAPTYQVSDGGIVNSGTITQYGDDATGGDRTDIRVGGQLGDTNNGVIVEHSEDVNLGNANDNTGNQVNGPGAILDQSPIAIDDHSDDGDDCTGASCIENPPETPPTTDPALPFGPWAKTYAPSIASPQIQTGTPMFVPGRGMVVPIAPGVGISLEPQRARSTAPRPARKR